MTILVTGGAGYIGSHVCKKLYNAGYKPIVYDNLVTGNSEAVKWGPLEIGDIRDVVRLREVLKKYQPEAIMHFAAFAYVGESILHPQKYYNNNVLGTLNLLELMLEQNINKFIFSSSCTTYGLPQSSLINESHPQNPVNPYGHSKLFVEQILKDFSKTENLKTIVFRYFNAAGADPEGDIGELHNPETHLIPSIFNVVLGKEKFITINGDDYETEDGTCIRDFIHVNDIADAHVLGLQSLEKDNFNFAYNLGNGKGFSVSQVINIVEEITNSEIKKKIGPRRIGDPSHLVSDASMIKSHLAWVPKKSNLKEIIIDAWEWHKKNY